MTGHNRTCVCVVKCSWQMKPSCWTLRRPTPMTTWKPRSRETTRSTTWNPAMTWHTWRTRERARSVAVFSVSLAVVTHLLHTSHGLRRSSVLSHSIPWSSPSMHEVSVLSDFLNLFITFFFLLSFLIIVPSTSPRLSSKIPCALLTNPSPTQVMSPRTTSSQRRTSSSIRSPWPSNGSPSNGSPSNGSSRTSITMMPQLVRCSLTHTETKSITPSEKGWLLVSRRRQCLIERGSPLQAQIRTLLDRQWEQILADCQEEIRRHKFQADQDQRSTQEIEGNDRVAASWISSRSSRRTTSTRSTSSSCTVIEAKLGSSWGSWEISMKWKNWSDFRCLHSTQLQEEDC